MLGYHPWVYIPCAVAFIPAACGCLWGLMRYRQEPARFWATARWLTAAVILGALNAVLFGDPSGRDVIAPALLLLAAGLVAVQVRAARLRKLLDRLNKTLGQW